MANNYKGRRFSVISSQELFVNLETLAKKEERTISQMAAMLIKEALLNRGIKTVNEEEESKVITDTESTTQTTSGKEKSPSPLKGKEEQ